MTEEYPIKSPRKLIEVALPLDAINVASAKEKSIRHGHPSTLHLWWARRPLAAARAVIFAQMVNDPGYQHGAGFKYGMNKKEAAKERKRLFDTIEEHVRDGVDFLTVHCGVTRSAIARLKQQKRVADIVSRGGAFMIGWMLYNGRENPLYEYYDRLLELAKEFDVTLSLGDGMRPGSLADATDRSQIEELLTIGELVERAQQAGVQAMVEGPGHLPLNQILYGPRI